MSAPSTVPAIPGSPGTLAQLVQILRTGGHGYVVGAAPRGTTFPFPTDGFLRNKHLHGVTLGNVRASVDIPRYVDLYLQGRLKLDEMITRKGRLEDVNDALRAMKAGEVARTVLMFD